MAGPEHTHATGGFHGGVGTVISVEEVTRQALEIARDVSVEQLDALAGNKPHLRIDDLNAGVKAMNAKLPQAFSTLPDQPLEIRRVPPEIQDGASNGYSVLGQYDKGNVFAYVGFEKAAETKAGTDQPSISDNTYCAEPLKPFIFGLV